MTDHGPDDPLPKLRADLDQALMMAPEVARVARGYFDSFSAEGFSDAHAAYFTICQLLQQPGSPR